MVGGIADLNLKVMADHGMLKRFLTVVEREYSATFGNDLKGESLGFKLPNATIPKLINDFSTCKT
jgi:hypothetical protein